MLTRVAVVAGRREHHVEGQPQGLLDHEGDYAVEQWARDLEAGVGVDFDEPGVEVLVDHEVQAEDFEVVLEVVWGEF